MNKSSSSILTYPLKEGVYVQIDYPDCDSLLNILPDFFRLGFSGSRLSYTSTIPYDKIPSGDREPSCYVFESISLGIAELEQRRAGIF